jgi:hypothetical protein
VVAAKLKMREATEMVRELVKKEMGIEFANVKREREEHELNLQA